jgi:decaprenyl-phosphate phosphoribosyltransferase
MQSCRPQQWKKNLLVYLAPIASGTILQIYTFWTATIIFLLFILLSSSVYLINDVLDYELDRQHPIKSKRPIASGKLPLRTATSLAVTLALTSMLFTFTLINFATGLVVLSYLLLQIAYVFVLKHEPVLDLLSVSLGFVLRAVAGAIACDLFVSGYFVLVTGSTALFVIAGKRYSELIKQGPNASIRPALRSYSKEYLRFVWGISVSMALIFYALWALEIDSGNGQFFAGISFIPFSIALLRIAQDIDSGDAEQPEDIFKNDKVLIIVGVVWIFLFGLRFIYA